MNSRSSVASAAADKKVTVSEQDVILYSVPTFFYFWPLMIAGYMLALVGLQGDNSALAVMVSKAYFGVMLLVVLTVGVNLNLWEAVFALFALWLSCLYLPPVAYVIDFAVYRGPGVTSGFALQLSNVLVIVYLLMWAYLKLYHYRITEASIVEHRFGQRDVSTTCAGKQLRAHYGSLLKVLIGFGAGDLVVRDADGQRHLMVLRDVPFLYFRFPAIERRLKTLPIAEDAL